MPLYNAPDPIVYDKHYLTPLFEPRSVAVVGATEREGAIASIVLKNLLAAKYRGHLFAVNPHHATVHGVQSVNGVGPVQRIDSEKYERQTRSAGRLRRAF